MSESTLTCMEVAVPSALSPYLPQRIHPLAYGRCCRDRLTGKLLSKEPRENVEIRREMILAAQGNEQIQHDLTVLAAASPFFFINNFVWAVHQKDILADGREVGSIQSHVPFVPWPVQDHAIGEMAFCIVNGVPVLLNKSRFMAGTLIPLSLFLWFWLFVSGSHFKVASRVEDLVDLTGDPDSLFGKLDYAIAWLPDWMLPGPKSEFVKGNKCRRHMMLINPANGNTIVGEATTANIGVGARRKAVLYDEMSRMPEAREAWRAGTDVTACKIGVSTPFGAGTEYTRQYNRGLATGQPHVIELLYFNHPEKGRDRVESIDRDGSVTGSVGRKYWRTNWLLKRIQETADPVDLAENVFADHTASGQSYFKGQMVSQHMRDFGIEPMGRFSIDPEFQVNPRHIGPWLAPDDRGAWYWFGPKRPEAGYLSSTDFILFADVASGVGSSNSVIAAIDVTARRIVAEYADPYCTPSELADELVYAARGPFAGRRQGALVGWESNGAGASMYQDVVERLKYRRVYYERREGSRFRTKTRRYGWQSDRRKKRLIMGGLSMVMSHHEVEVPSKPGLMEMGEYVYFDDGSIGPGSQRDMTSGARETHGDRVVAYAGCVLLLKDAPKFWQEAGEAWADGTWGKFLGFTADGRPA